MNFFAQPQEISQAEKELRPLLLDEGCQVLSTFELNKLASLTYGDLVCDDIFEFIEKIVAHPLEYTPLTVQKTLVVTKHLLIYGSEKCVNSGYGIGRFVEELTTFNTVLAAQQQQGAKSFFQRLQGGGVDRGGPVREAAIAVQKLLSNINTLQQIRNESASRNSLVPIGDDKVAFITDEVRHHILKKKIEQQAQIEIKSNLKKSEGGFGGGYMATDGKSVVGAAHGIEEMLKMANRGKKKFSDDGDTGPSPEDKILEDLAAQAKREKEEAARAAAQNVDLLGSFDAQPPQSATSGASMDLLDLGSTIQTTQPPPTNTSTRGDLLGAFGAPSTQLATNNDLLGLSHGANQLQGGLLGLGNVTGVASFNHSAGPPSVDPFASAPNTLTSSTLPMTAATPGEIVGDMTSLALDKNAAKKSVMASNEDRFSALDALATSNNMPMGMTTVPPSGENMVTPGSGQVAAAYGDSNSNEKDDPWVMGGAVGTGLQPIGAAPAAPPPPPPP